MKKSLIRLHLIFIVIVLAVLSACDKEEDYPQPEYGVPVNYDTPESIR